MEFTEEQLNFLTMLREKGRLMYSRLGDYYKDDERAKNELMEMHENGHVNFDGNFVTLTEKGFNVVKNRTTYRTP